MDAVICTFSLSHTYFVNIQCDSAYLFLGFLVTCACHIVCVFFFHVQSHLRCVDGSDGRNTIAWVMKEEQCARTARFTHDIYGAYHGAPLECGDGAGDGPHMASAVTSPGYAGCQDPAKRVTVTSDMARPLTRPVTSVTPSCLKGKGPSKIPKNPKQKMEKKKESAPHIISHSGIIAYLLYCSVQKMLHF